MTRWTGRQFKIRWIRKLVSGSHWVSGSRARLDLLLHEQALHHFPVSLVQPRVVQPDAELQRVPQVRILQECSAMCSATCSANLSEVTIHLRHGPRALYLKLDQGVIGGMSGRRQYQLGVA